MKKSLCILSLFLITCSAKAQTVSFSPISAPLWGQLERTMVAEIEYSNFSLIAVHPLEEQDIKSHRESDYSRYSGYFLGIFYSPITLNYKDISINPSVGIWSKRFPTNKGQILYLKLNIDYAITDKVSISYSHLSNGFGIANKLNPGLDSIGIRIHI